MTADDQNKYVPKQSKGKTAKAKKTETTIRPLVWYVRTKPEGVTSKARSEAWKMLSPEAKRKFTEKTYEARLEAMGTSTSG